MIPASTSFGDDVTPAGSGSKALLLSFDGFATKSYDGGIGAKYYIMEPLAIRAAIQFAYANQSIPANAPSGASGTDGSISGVRFGLSGAAEYHFLKTRVSPYVGGGFGISNTSTKFKAAVIAPATQTTIDNEAGGDTIGGNFFAGGTTFTLVSSAALNSLSLKN